MGKKWKGKGKGKGREGGGNKWKKMTSLKDIPEKFEAALKKDTSFYTDEKIAHYTQVFGSLMKQMNQVIESNDETELDRLMVDIEQQYADYVLDSSLSMKDDHDYITYLMNLLFTALNKNTKFLKKYMPMIKAADAAADAAPSKNTTTLESAAPLEETTKKE